jgi:hypothetical protein
MVASPRDYSQSYQLLLTLTGNKPHDFLGPECHLSMTETTMAVDPIGAIYETVPTMRFASDGTLELIVSPDLGVLFMIQRWWDITFPPSLL